MIATTVAILNTGSLDRHKANRFVISSFIDAVVIWLAMEVMTFYTLHRLATGDAYIFTPRGLGIPIDAAIHIGLFTGFFVFYSLPSFMARAWLGWILRAVMFGIFVVFLTYMAMSKIIAIVQTPDHRIIFYPCYPLAPQTYTWTPGATMHQNSAVTSIQFASDTPEGLMLYPVYNVDTAGRAEIGRLRGHIQVMMRSEGQ